MDTATSGKWMVKCATVCSLLMLSLTISTKAVHAQGEQPRISVDLGTGFGKGVGGGFLARRNLFAGMTQAAARMAAKDSHSLLVAFNITGFSSFDTTDECLVPIELDGPGSRCAAHFPGGAAFSLMAGFQQKLREVAAVRVFAGPAVYSTKDPGSRIGTQTRIDIAIPAQQHVAFVMWGQYSFMPITNRPGAQIRMGGVGFRFQ